MSRTSRAIAHVIAPVIALVIAFGGIPLAGQQPSAEALAQSLQQQYDKVRDFKASFVQTTKGAVLKVQSKGEGTVAVKKPGKMRWEYTKPERQLIVSDGIRMYDYDPVTKELNVAALPPDDQAPTATLFLAGKGNILRDFKVSKVDSPVAGTLALRLDPRRVDPDYEYLVVAFDPSSYQIRGLMTRDRQRGESTIVFSDIKPNTNIPDKTFEFVQPRK
jgi:outer membrane lipoprotein carrier protein